MMGKFKQDHRYIHFFFIPTAEICHLLIATTFWLNLSNKKCDPTSGLNNLISFEEEREKHLSSFSWFSSSPVVVVHLSFFTVQQGDFSLPNKLDIYLFHWFFTCKNGEIGFFGCYGFLLKINILRTTCR
jgi:hypothetical protein